MTVTMISPIPIVPSYATSAKLPTDPEVGQLAFETDDTTIYVWTGSAWLSVSTGAGSGFTGFGTFDSGVPSAMGASASGNNIIFQSATTSNPGMVNASASLQTFGGPKQFNGNVTLNSGFFYPASAILNYAMLCSNAGSGAVTWAAIPTSVQGTNNGVLVNTTTGIQQTGAITLNTVQSIGTSSAVQFGSLGLGSSLATSSILSLSSTTSGFLPPVMTTTQKNAIATPATGLVVYDSTLSDLEFYNGSSWVGTTLSGVISLAGTANQIVASASTGAITLSFPTTGGLSLGSYQSVTPPTGGIIFPGQLGVGTNSPVSTSQISVVSTNARVLNFSGTLASVDGSTKQGSLYLNNTFSPTSGSTFSSVVEGLPVFSVASGQTVTAASIFHASPLFTANAGTITSLYNFYYDGGGAGSGVITNHYGAYIAVPVGGTNKTAIYGDNLAIGYTGVSPGVNNVVIAGQLSIGSSSQTTSTVLSLTSTVAGLLPPRMSTTQKNAIVTPATGLVIYDNVLNDLEFYNGSSWIGTTLSGVTSIAGTSNQIALSSSTGSVTASLTNGISLGSYQATGSPTGGLLFPGQYVQGTGTVGTSAFSQINNTVNQYALNVTGAFTGTQNQIAIYNQQSFTYSGTGSPYQLGYGANVIYGAASGKTVLYASDYYSSPSFTNNVGTITNATGFYYDGGQSTSGTVTNIYGGYFANPAGTAGTSKMAVYAANMSVGYATTTPPTSGIVVSGQAGFGTSSITSTATSQVQISSTGGVGTAKLVISGNSIDGTSDTDGMALGLVHNSSGSNKQFFIGLSNLLASSSSNPIIRFAPNASGLIDCIATNDSTVLPFTLGNSGSITNVKGSFVGVNDAAAASTLSVVGNAQIGFSSGTVAPTNGLIVAQSSVIGSSSQTASAILSLVSSTQGFLPPSNSSPSANISSPATGLQVYDSLFNVPFYYNGSAWLGMSGLSLLSSLTFSNDAAVSYNTSSSLPLTSFNSILIVFENLLPVSGGNSLGVQLTTNGGSSYLTTGYSGGVTTNAASSSATWTNSNSTASIILGTAFADTGPASGHLYITNMNYGNPQIFGKMVQGGTFGEVQSTQSTAAINGFKIFFGTGNISTATIAVYGLIGA